MPKKLDVDLSTDDMKSLIKELGIQGITVASKLPVYDDENEDSLSEISLSISSESENPGDENEELEDKDKEILSKLQNDIVLFKFEDDEWGCFKKMTDNNWQAVLQKGSQKTVDQVKLAATQVMVDNNNVDSDINISDICYTSKTSLIDGISLIEELSDKKDIDKTAIKYIMEHSSNYKKEIEGIKNVINEDTDEKLLNRAKEFIDKHISYDPKDASNEALREEILQDICGALKLEDKYGQGQVDDKAIKLFFYNSHIKSKDTNKDVDNETNSSNILSN